MEMDPFDSSNPDFASPEMTAARAEVNDAAAVNGEGQIEVAPAMANDNFDNPAMPVAPVMAAGTPEGAMEMAGGDAGGMGAMGDWAGAPEGAPGAPMDINPADAALGAAMDSAMDQGGAPGSAAEAHEAGFEDAAAFAAAQDDDQDSSDDDGGLAG
jgi:hypothetical protein